MKPTTFPTAGILLALWLAAPTTPARAQASVRDQRPYARRDIPERQYDDPLSRERRLRRSELRAPFLDQDFSQDEPVPASNPGKRDDFRGLWEERFQLRDPAVHRPGGPSPVAPHLEEGPMGIPPYGSSSSHAGRGSPYAPTKSLGAGDWKAPHTFTGGVDTAWVRHYASGLAPSSDYANAMVVDAEGNIYVTGYSQGLGTYDDYATVKYNPEGVQQWVARYDGPGNFTDRATALAVDGGGNIYVTGISYGSGTWYDYATVKYDADGVEQWVARYNGPENATDRTTALAVDGGGNVYVTGLSGIFPEYDYATVKYDTAGVQQWVARYNGPRHSYDRAAALAVDGGGNVYVTGISESGTYDYATVKYDTAGVEQWVARYDGPGYGWDGATALAVDDGGNVYITGYSTGSGTSYDYATVKYDSEGVEQWVARYNGPENATDRTTALAVDGGGNVYVTGLSGIFPEYDYATVKYDTAGVQQWVARYDGPENAWDRATALAVDGGGNVYVTGGSGPRTGLWGQIFYPDYATVKYDTAGAEQWVARYSGPENSYDEAVALAVDGRGNVYVTGISYSGTSMDYATVKYNPEGVEQWVARYNGPGNSSDEAVALAVDGGGNVYVTGESYGSGASYDYATVKYSPEGVEDWVAHYDGPGRSNDGAVALALDGGGNVYVTGRSGSGRFSDYATVKYNPEGVEQWVARYERSFEDYATALAVDGGGNVYVTGGSEGSGTFFDYATVKYSPAGVQQWVARYHGPGHSRDRATALAVDGGGNVYVTGSSSSDYATVKYDSVGVQQWVARYDSPGNKGDEATALALDGTGNVYVTGSSTGAGTSIYTTIKYVQTPSVAVAERPFSLPTAFLLAQNYPNPFNPVTTLRFDLPVAATVSLVVYDLRGREVVRLADQRVEPGYHQVTWDGRDRNGREVPTGVYIARLVTAEYAKSIKLILLK